jgi:hypothetical protein
LLARVGSLCNDQPCAVERRTAGALGLTHPALVSQAGHFSLTFSRPYSYTTDRPNEQAVFLEAVVKVFRRATNGRLPELVNFALREAGPSVPEGESPSVNPCRDMGRCRCSALDARIDPSTRSWPSPAARFRIVRLLSGLGEASAPGRRAQDRPSTVARLGSVGLFVDPSAEWQPPCRAAAIRLGSVLDERLL